MGISNPAEPYFIYALVDPRDPLIIRYIGKTNNMPRRLNNHRNNLQDKKDRDAEKPISHKECWINKIKREGVLPEMILIERTILSEVDEKEVFYISYFSNIFKDKLTNVSKGGSGGSTPASLKAVSKQCRCSNGITYNSIAEASRNLKINADSISSCILGKINNVQGYSFSSLDSTPPIVMVKPKKPKKDYTNTVLRAKSPTDKIYKKSNDGINTNRIVKCSNGKVYESIDEAVTNLKIWKDSILSCLKGELNNVKGYSFSRFDSEPPPIIPKKWNSKTVKVRCSNGKDYLSLTKASIELEVSVRSIRMCLDGKMNNVRGYSFSDIDSIPPVVIRRVINREAIVCSNGKVYPSKNQASKELRISFSCISRCLDKGLSSASGFSFCYLDKGTPPIVTFDRPRVNSKKILCSNGKTYSSLTEAAKILGLDISAISFCLSGRINHTKGFSFCFAGNGNTPPIVNNLKRISCSNGKIYQSTVEASKDFGVSVSCICRYLKSSTKNKKGHTFTRCA